MPTPPPPVPCARPRCGVRLVPLARHASAAEAAGAVRRRRRGAARAVEGRRPAAADQAVHALLRRRHRRQARREDRGRPVVRQPRPSAQGGRAGAARLAVADREADRGGRPAPSAATTPRSRSASSSTCRWTACRSPIASCCASRAARRASRCRPRRSATSGTRSCRPARRSTTRSRGACATSSSRRDRPARQWVARSATSAPTSCKLFNDESPNRAADRRHRDRRRFRQHPEPHGVVRERRRPRALSASPAAARSP